MIYLLEKEKIEKCWDIIEEGVKLSLPPALLQDKESMNYVKAALLKGDLTCWIGTGETKDDIRGICITAISVDVGTRTKSLLIYALYAYELIPKETWYEGMVMLKEFARKMECNNITAFSSNKRALGVAEKLNGDTNTRFIMFDV